MTATLPPQIKMKKTDESAKHILHGGALLRGCTEEPSTKQAAGTIYVTTDTSLGTPRRDCMVSIKMFVAAGALATGLLVAQSPANAEAGGCLKYGAAGAVGGHLAGHGVIGALAGCGAGMWTRHEARKHAADEQNATSELNRQNRAPEYQGSNDTPTPFYRQ